MLVSVIMPIYKVESFLPRAIESVLGQTMADFELILVDDGSPDRSGEICDEYALKDDRIRVIHQQNQGAPAARNNAMAVSQGKYRFFCDADDWLEKGLLEKLTAEAERTNAELVICGFSIDTDSRTGAFHQEHCAPAAFYQTAADFRKNAAPLFDNNLLYTPWNKLFSAERMDRLNIRFPGTFWDDFPFNLSYIRDVGSVAIISDILYHFTRFRAESETAKYVPQMYEKREEEDKWMRELYAYWQLEGEKEKEFLARRYAERLVGCIENLTNPLCTLTVGEKLASIRKMLCAPRAKEALALAKPGSAMLRLMFLPLKMRWTLWAYAQSQFITFVKTRFTKLFAFLKASRGKAKK